MSFFLILVFCCYLNNAVETKGVTNGVTGTPVTDTDGTYTCSEPECIINEEHCNGL